MRLDKFMKVARLSKRRSEAHEALEHGRITKDGKPLKPAYNVKPGDVLEIQVLQVEHRGWGWSSVIPLSRTEMIHSFFSVPGSADTWTRGVSAP